MTALGVAFGADGDFGAANADPMASLSSSLSSSSNKADTSSKTCLSLADSVLLPLFPAFPLLLDGVERTAVVPVWATDVGAVRCEDVMEADEDPNTCKQHLKQ